MKQVVLIPCVSQKLPHAALAKDLYVSSLFKFCLRYAQTRISRMVFGIE